MLLEAVRLTVPQFDLERAGLGPYSGEELRLIMLIANTYTAGQRYEEAERVYRIGSSVTCSFNIRSRLISLVDSSRE